MELIIKLNAKSDVFSIITFFSRVWKNIKNRHIKIHLNFENESIIDCTILVIISSIVNELQLSNQQISVQFEGSNDSPSIEYAANIGFFRTLKPNIKNIFQQNDPNSHFINITHLAPNIYNLNDAFLDIFDTHFDLNPESLNSLVFVFDELICNTTRHCQSQNGGYYFCQKNTNRNTIDVVIVDSGMGIQKSLNRAFPRYNELKCLEECIKFGVTCGDGRGHGLYFISELLKRNEGEFMILSGFTHLKIKNGKITTGKMLIGKAQLSNVFSI
jgi:hypothetical protein